VGLPAKIKIHPMSIKENLKDIRTKIPSNVRLVAVSKTMPVDALQEAYNAGQRHFGENKVQEITYKQEVLPSDIEWHFIGHLQTNKVKYIVPFVTLIESVDSLKLLREIHKQGKKINRKINCLLQFHIAEEETKFGLDLDEAGELLVAVDKEHLDSVIICGVMGMATYTDDSEQIRKEFRHLKENFDWLKENFFKQQDEFKEISMGMSGDFLLAIEEGSTNVRIGSSIFGVRTYM
jgi:PLP dependent protein